MVIGRDDLAWWAQAELWEVAYEGVPIAITNAYEVSRARCLKCIDAWSDDVAPRFVRYAREEAQRGAQRSARPALSASLLDQLALDLGRTAALAGYLAALAVASAASTAADARDRFLEARTAQSRWIADQLGLPP